MLHSTHVEREELAGGKVRDTIHIKKIAYRRDGSLRRIGFDWKQGDQNFPHVITDSDTLVYTAADGMRRICPTGEPSRYFEIGPPMVKPATKWTKVAFGTATRAANTISWPAANGQATLRILLGGHFVKLEVELAPGYSIPGGKLAFPVGLNGLTRTGGAIFADGKQVMSMQLPVAYDAANPMGATVSIPHSFAVVSGQAYIILDVTSIDMSGWARPVIDPTFTDGPGGDVTTSMDAGIVQEAATFNAGIAQAVLIGEKNAATELYRLLIKFTLTAIPETAVISSAILSLYCVGDNSANARTMRVYRTKRAWVEGTRNWAADSPATGCTWNRYDLTNNWSTAGGFHADDCEQTDIGSRNFTASETVNEFKEFALTPTTRACLDLGNGWLLKADTEENDAYAFITSDHPTIGQRPKLVVVYTLPGGGGIFASSIFHSAIHGRTLTR